MTPRQPTIRRFTARHIANHWVMIITFIGLVITGMPQKFADHGWAKGVVLIFGGVERVRFVHHLLGTIMALQLVWHVLEAFWLHLVRKLPAPMIPRLDDVKHFMQQVRFNLGNADAPPRMERYTFAEKIEYLALVWGTALMVLTGMMLLYPVKFSTLWSGEIILAAKAAHGGEAILALLSILTWHVYFVHIRHWNNAIFTGRMDEEAYAEEHPLELERIRRGQVFTPGRIQKRRLVLFAVCSSVVLLGLALFVSWLEIPLPIPTIPLKIAP